MHGLDKRGIARACLQRRVLVGPETLGHIILLPIQVREVEPSPRLLAVSPDPRKGVELWTIGRQAHQAHGLGEDQALGSLGPAGIEAQEMETRGERLGERVKAELQHRRLQIGPFQEAPLAGHGLHGTIDVEPVEDVWHGTDRLYAPRREAPAADRQEAEPAFVLAAHPDGTKIVGRDGLLELGMTGRLGGRNRVRGFWGAWAAPR
jgi:hypothetical protein